MAVFFINTPSPPANKYTLYLNLGLVLLSNLYSFILLFDILSYCLLLYLYNHLHR